MTEPAAKPAQAAPATAAVTIEDFKKLELRTAKILEVSEHPSADRLWVVKIDVGGVTKQIVAGVKAHYPKEELVGKTVIVVNNLQPSVIRGVESQGMLLAAKNSEMLTIVSVDKPIAPGASVG